MPKTHKILVKVMSVNYIEQRRLKNSLVFVILSLVMFALFGAACGQGNTVDAAKRPAQLRNTRYDVSLQLVEPIDCSFYKFASTSETWTFDDGVGWPLSVTAVETGDVETGTKQRSLLFDGNRSSAYAEYMSHGVYVMGIDGDSWAFNETHTTELKESYRLLFEASRFEGEMQKGVTETVESVELYPGDSYTQKINECLGTYRVTGKLTQP